jgi:glutamate--cysteine ligase
MRADAPRLGLRTPFRKGSLQDVARRAVSIAVEGLRARGRMNRMGDSDETHFLNPLVEIAESGVTPAERLLERFHGPWKGSVDPSFAEEAY